MPKSDLQLHSGEYAPVADRITLFYRAFPTGRIVSELLSHEGGRMIVKALVFRDARDTEPAATGLAAEREDDGEINKVACLENTETSAIGRALANLGFTASKQRPSREEMEKAARERSRLGKRLMVISEGAPAGHAVGPEALQRRANAVHDVLDLMERAEAQGFSTRRALILREALLRPTVTPDTVVRVERRIRAWIARRRASLG